MSKHYNECPERISKLDIPIIKTEMNEDEKTVAEHLSKLCNDGRIDKTREYIRVCWNLINDTMDVTGEDLPLELRLAIDMLHKIDVELEYYDTSLSEDIKILQGKFQRIE